MKTYPTTEQLYALEHAARRARNAEMARLAGKVAKLARTGARALKQATARLVESLRAKGVRHA